MKYSKQLLNTFEAVYQTDVSIDKVVDFLRRHGAYEKLESNKSVEKLIEEKEKSIARAFIASFKDSKGRRRYANYSNNKKHYYINVVRETSSAKLRAAEDQQKVYINGVKKNYQLTRRRRVRAQQLEGQLEMKEMLEIKEAINP